MRVSKFSYHLRIPNEASAFSKQFRVKIELPEGVLHARQAKYPAFIADVPSRQHGRFPEIQGPARHGMSNMRIFGEVHCPGSGRQSSRRSHTPAHHIIVSPLRLKNNADPIFRDRVTFVEHSNKFTGSPPNPGLPRLRDRAIRVDGDYFDSRMKRFQLSAKLLPTAVGNDHFHEGPLRQAFE